MLALFPARSLTATSSIARTDDSEASCVRPAAVSASGTLSFPAFALARRPAATRLPPATTLAAARQGSLQESSRDFPWLSDGPVSNLTLGRVRSGMQVSRPPLGTGLPPFARQRRIILTALGLTRCMSSRSE